MICLFFVINVSASSNKALITDRILKVNLGSEKNRSSNLNSFPGYWNANEHLLIRYVVYIHNLQSTLSLLKPVTYRKLKKDHLLWQIKQLVLIKYIVYLLFNATMSMWMSMWMSMTLSMNRTIIIFFFFSGLKPSEKLPVLRSTETENLFIQTKY